MSFKIIQELNKRNCTVLTIIPAAFEVNGVYWFPPSNWSTKKLNSVLKNPFSKPEISKWGARPCCVKRSNIPTFALAEEQEEELLNKAITEVEDDADVESESSYTCVQDKRNRSHQLARSPQANFNSALEQCLDSLPDPQRKTYQAEDAEIHVQNFGISDVNEKFNVSEIVLNDDDYYEPDRPQSGYTVVCDNSPSLAADGVVSLILENQEKIFKEITKLTEVITTGLAKILTQNDCLTKIHAQRLNQDVKNNIVESAENFEKIYFGENAYKFEDQLLDIDFKGELIQKMSFVIGKNGKRIGQGWTCCYELVDSVFDRSFLTQCSWTGASTSRVEEGKIPFLKLKNILMLFATVVTNADPDFSIEKTKEFFKKLLRNSTRFQSQEMSQTRKSTKRERGSRILKNQNIKATERKIDEIPSNNVTSEERMIHLTGHGA